MVVAETLDTQSLTWWIIHISFDRCTDCPLLRGQITERPFPSMYHLSHSRLPPLVEKIEELGNTQLFAGEGFVGLPPFRPLALAAVRPAVVRSRIGFRSNSASAPKIWKISLPPLVVVSIFSVRLLNPMPRSSRLVRVVIRCGRERPKRSSRQTTSVSPFRT